MTRLEFLSLKLTSSDFLLKQPISLFLLILSQFQSVRERRENEFFEGSSRCHDNITLLWWYYGTLLLKDGNVNIFRRIGSILRSRKMNFSKKKDVKIIYDDLNIFQPVESILSSKKRDEFLIKYSQYCNKYYCTLTILHHSSSYREGMLIFFLEVGSISTRSRRIKNESGQTGKINFVRTACFRVSAGSISMRHAAVRGLMHLYAGATARFRRVTRSNNISHALHWRYSRVWFQKTRLLFPFWSFFSMTVDNTRRCVTFLISDCSGWVMICEPAKEESSEQPSPAMKDPRIRFFSSSFRASRFRWWKKRKKGKRGKLEHHCATGNAGFVATEALWDCWKGNEEMRIFWIRQRTHYFD